MWLAVNLHATGASKAVYANPPDWAEMQAWRRLLRPGDLFVDVGSNVGLYSLWAADCDAVTIAIEPDAANAELTRQNLIDNGVEGEVYVCALAAESGTQRFTVGMDAVNHLMSEGQPGTSREVPASTLDKILAGRHARGVKVDVEGAERLVLEGATESLATQRIDIMQLEWNSLSTKLLGESRRPVKEILHGAGYILCRPDPQNFELRSVDPGDQSDVDVFAIAPWTRESLMPGLRR